MQTQTKIFQLIQCSHKKKKKKKRKKKKKKKNKTKKPTQDTPKKLDTIKRLMRTTATGGKKREEMGQSERGKTKKGDGKRGSRKS